jgi:hypothetical protein
MHIVIHFEIDVNTCTLQQILDQRAPIYNIYFVVASHQFEMPYIYIYNLWLDIASKINDLFPSLFVN